MSQTINFEENRVAKCISILTKDLMVRAYKNSLERSGEFLPDIRKALVRAYSGSLEILAV